jgi:hypothetical protein
MRFEVFDKETDTYPRTDYNGRTFYLTMEDKLFVMGEDELIPADPRYESSPPPKILSSKPERVPRTKRVLKPMKFTPFMEKYRKDPTLDVDDAVDEWHTGSFDCTLPEYLGMTREQYAAWVHTSKLPE